jgi:hypothetical protein
MSNLAPQFVNAARAKNWKTAYDECNGCTMTAMLDGMQEIGPDLLKDMRAQMATFDVWGGPFMARIAWAMDIIQKRTVTVPQPQGVPDDQVGEARTFLSKNPAAAAAASTHKVRIALFWTEAAKGDMLSSRLVQKARELLKSNNTGFDLDVYQVHTDLPYKGEISDSNDATKALDMARAAPAYAADRLVVIFYKVTPTECDANRQRCPRVPFANTPRDGAGNPYILVNVNKTHPDNATLLHEIGHAAGVESRDSDDNLADLDDVMSYGTNRTKIGANQLNKMKRHGLFFMSS